MRISKSSVSQQANRKQSDIYRFFWILRKRACLMWSPVFPSSTSCYYYNILAQSIIRYTFYFFHFSSPFYSGPQKGAEKSPNHGTYFDFALGISYKVLFPVLDRPTAQFKTACTKFRNGLRDSLKTLEQN